MGRMSGWVSQTTRFYAWRGGLTDVDGGVPALIAEKPVSIVVVRQDPTTHAKTVLDAQTVRVELDSRLLAPLQYGRTPSSSVTNPQKVILLGYKNDRLVPDTDLALMDTFLLEGQQFTVRKIEATLADRLLAEAEAEG